jgi:glycosyltransferase domain-containing protein
MISAPGSEQMNLLVIPTYNRSAKLERVLDWYGSQKLQARIVVLDASSDTMHREANQKAVEKFGELCVRMETPEHENVPQRLLKYLETIDDELVAIGNDEDAFIPEFMTKAFGFLRENPQYVVAVGRYLTLCRPLLGLRRISFWTDSFVGLDVDEPDAAVRVVTFQRMNSGGISPLYWSVRRRTAFVQSCRLALRMRYGSGHELVDQITSCALGKISIDDSPMLLRDETRKSYSAKSYTNRDTGKLYMSMDDLDEMERISLELWGPEVTVAVRAVTAWYRPKRSGDSLQYRLGRRAYCRFHEMPEERGSRTLAGLHRIIKFSCTAGVLFSQVLAYLYFLKYMSQKGRGSSFVRMTKALPVNKVPGRA